MSKNIDLLNDKPSKCFYSFLFPTVLSMIAFSCYVVVDVMFVGFFEGSNGLAAMSICLPFFTISTSIALLLGVGAATTISVLRGSGDEESANKIFTMTVITNVVIGISLTIIYQLFTQEIVRLFGSDDHLLPYAMDYFGPVSMVTFAFVLSNTLQAIIRSDGDPKFIMIASTIANLLNVVLDYVLMVHFKMGIRGASIATGLSPVVVLIFIGIYYLKKQSRLKLVAKPWDMSLYKRIFKNGIGVCILEFSAGVIIYLFNNVLLSLGGAVAVATYSIISNVQFIGRSIFNGISQSMQPILSVSYGAGKLDRFHETWKVTLRVVVVFSLIFFGFVAVFPEQVAGFFVNNDPQVMSTAKDALRLYYSSFVFTGVNTILMFYCQSLERSKYSMIIAVLQGMVFVVLGMVVLVPLLGINGVWLTITFAEIATLIVAIPLKIQTDKKIKALLNPTTI